MVTKQCSFCKTEITRQVYLFRGDNQFCNLRCKMEFLNAGVVMKKKLTRYIQTRCENCGNGIDINHRQLVLENVHFCKDYCKNEWLETLHGIKSGFRFAPGEFRQEEKPQRMHKGDIFFQGEKYEINTPWKSS